MPAHPALSRIRMLALVSDAFGGRGGIAKFNRDLLSALCASPGVLEVAALPRLIQESPGTLPRGIRYITSAAGGKLRFVVSSLKYALTNPRATMIFCGHVNLLPVAFLTRLFMARPSRGGLSDRLDPFIVPDSRRSIPIVLMVHGIDAWRPTRSPLVNRLAAHVDALISVSEFTRNKFLAWTASPGTDSLERGGISARIPRPPPRTFILPNCVDLSRFTPGPKNTSLTHRYGLQDRVVLLTVGRLSAAERYKGVDEVLEVLPSLIGQVPNLTYLIVGEGTDRARLARKARSLELSVFEANGANDGASGWLSVSHRLRRQSSQPPSNGQPPFSRSHRGISLSETRPQVIFCGWIAESEKVDYYRLADLFVMPGRGEGFGIVYLEAMACGVPVVASRADASHEVVDRAGFGVSVNPDDKRELQRVILTSLGGKRPQVTPKLDEFSTTRFAERCLAIFAEACSK